MKIELDNAQSGGPKITITKDGIVIGHIYPRAEDETMQYWDFGKGTKTLAEMPEQAKPFLLAKLSNVEDKRHVRLCLLLARLGVDEIVPVVQQRLHSVTDWFVRYQYLDALAVVTDPTAKVKELARVTQRRSPSSGRPAKAFNPLSKEDLLLFKAVMQGGHNVRGFTNRDVRCQLAATPHLSGLRSDPRRQSAKVSRLFHRLHVHVHGLIAKIPRSRRFTIKPSGPQKVSDVTTNYVSRAASPERTRERHPGVINGRGTSRQLRSPGCANGYGRHSGGAVERLPAPQSGQS